MIQEATGQFTGAVRLEWQASKAGAFTLALIAFDTAPTTAENIRIAFVSGKSAAFDTILHTTDPQGLENVTYSPDTAILLNEGDKIVLDYPNTDARTVGVTLKGLDSSSF